MKCLTAIGRSLQHSAKPNPFSFPPQLCRTKKKSSSAQSHREYPNRQAKLFSEPQPGVADGPVGVSVYLIPVSWCNWSACWTRRAGLTQRGPPACHMRLTRWLNAEGRRRKRRLVNWLLVIIFIIWNSCPIQKETFQPTSMELYRCLEKLYSMSRAVKLSTAKSRALSCPLSGWSHTNSHDIFSTVWPASHRMPSKRSRRSTQW